MGRRLGLEVLGAVLAGELDPGLGERAELLERDVLDGRQDLHAAGQLLAHAREVLADAAGVEAGDQLRHAIPACRPVTPPSRRCEKNRPNAAHRAEAAVVHGGAVELGAQDLREVEVAARAGVVAVEGGVDLVADLVAARPRARGRSAR